MTVRRGLQKGIHGHGTARPRLGFHDHGLLQALGEGIPHGARQDIGGCTGRADGDDADGPVRQRLGWRQHGGRSAPGREGRHGKTAPQDLGSD
ncbi:hypothetical protein D3C78_1616790 [compost metagenome]